MNEQRQLLADSVGQVFQALGPAAGFEAGWAQIEALGLQSLFRPEQDGGFGGGWADALVVFQLAGRHAAALPAPEAVLAAAAAPDEPGLGSIAPRLEGRLQQDRFTGTAKAVPWGRHAQYLLAADDRRGGSILLRCADAGARELRTNVAGEPRDDLSFVDAPAQRLEAPIDAVSALALARVAQIAGALEAALEQSVLYVNERVQFGKPLGKFQAVQQSLATFAAETAAVSAAAAGACAAADRGDADFEIAAAKLRANMAVGVGTSIAHQVHGAMGFTREYTLHPFTRRLWAWRSEFGNDSAWAARLGAMVIARGPEEFWADLVARSDPPD